MNAVDTNVLIYAHDPRDQKKQNQATALISSLSDGVLLWQVACEYVSASRKLAAFGLNSQRAFADLTRLQSVWIPSLPTWEVLDKAEVFMATGNLSYWDAMILAACAEAGVRTLYSEDFDDSMTPLTGIRVVNPFV
ncbi:MAG: PIN domain-containing protein [Blastocatellia bacterium]|nr:PIN domain-containing protein [Blastocatellia bacterium]